MSYNKKSGPCYSNVSLIKKAIYQSRNGMLPFPDIVLYLKLNWSYESAISMSTDKLVEMALYAPKSFFHENENGLWEAKKQIDNNLDFIIDYVTKLHRPFQLKEVIKKFSINDELKIFEQDLLSDIRFTQIQDTPYLMLSKWELMNDLVYEYMQRNEIGYIKQEEATKLVVNEYDLDEEMIIFAPNIDKRFSVKGKYMYIVIEVQVDIANTIIAVPEEIKEEVARKSAEILRFIQSVSEDIRTKDLIPAVFNVKANDSKFSIYYEAIEEFLDTFSELSCLTKGRWIFNHSVATIELENKTSSWKYAIYGSVPVIQNINELQQLESQQIHNDLPEQGSTITEENNVLKQIGYHTISYYERIKGYFSTPSELVTSFNSMNQSIGLINAEVDGFKYEWRWRNQEGAYYFYGDGVVDFFSDYLIEVGQRLKLRWLNEISVGVDLLGEDERYATEQNRYLDIGRLVEESKSVNKSIYTIMCEVLATYPSGMHWTQLLDSVNEIRTTTKNTVYNLLGKNDCFESVKDKKGYWRLIISKLSRYYVDEEGNEIEEDFSQNNADSNSAIKLNIPEKDSAITEKYIIQKVKSAEGQNRITESGFSEKSKYQDLYDWNDQYEVPPLWEKFPQWAEEQKNLRYEAEIEEVDDDTEKLKLITDAYSKLLVRYAKSRSTYSIERMDLVQEGFFGILRGMQTYKHYKGGSLANHLGQWVFSKISRHLTDSRTLIRYPAHMVESVHKYEKLYSETLLLENRKPTIQELKKALIKRSVPQLAVARNIDYISFEQLWLNNDLRSSKKLDHWLVAEYIDDKSGKHHYYERTKAQLIRSLDDLTNAIECSTNEDGLLDNSFEDHIVKRELRRKLSDLLEALPVKEQNVVRLRYGFDDGMERTLEEVGKVFGLTRERIRQIELKALRRMKNLGKKLELQIFIQDDILEVQTRIFNDAKNKEDGCLNESNFEEIVDEIAEVAEEATEDVKETVEKASEEAFEKQIEAKDIDLKSDDNWAHEINKESLNHAVETTQAYDITDYLCGLKVIDNRKKGGALWVIGGVELTTFFDQLILKGIVFRYSASGGKATNHKPAWWVKEEVKQRKVENSKASNTNLRTNPSFDLDPRKPEEGGFTELSNTNFKITNTTESITILVDNISSSKVNLISLIHKNKLVENKYLKVKYNEVNKSYYHFDADDLSLLSIEFPDLKPHKVGSINYWADKIIYKLYELIDNGLLKIKVLHEDKIVTLNFMWLGAPKKDPLHSMFNTKRTN
ncbi:sigma-70 family RNA polymerase sigma factor [Paenibacillus sp. Soil787]|uniref:sigma-70 family RNA polymerase sigma factor n=1 Tax=Paenibacillus sp. Soil787 TaxID=1736411 RepID=UPI0006F99D77|nr:sigma-70 family RNA polymerase sigma factor [Paenibacillus sp. Soil787]KRF39825.1 hypothetical protein ASG93_22950 [Paenibacillus sp. Soil787]